MSHRVLLSLLTVAVLLSAVPWELSAQGPAVPVGSADAAQALLNDSGNPGPTETGVSGDCVCLCTLGHSTPAMAQDVLATIDRSHACSMAALPTPEASVHGSVFHPPQFS